MKEKLLQFIWQFQYYNRNNLTTTTGEQLQIIDPGKANTDQGPDFLQAKIKINEVLWIGNIEIHIKSGTWYLHRHHTDSNFNNIILHVVWQQDVVVTDYNGIPLQTLVLQDRVPKLLLKKYEGFMQHDGFIACESHLPSVNPIIFSSWKERLIIERLQKRTLTIMEFQSQNNHHWEETFWWLLAKNFGIKVNTQAFELMARSLPVNLLAKHKNQVLQIEALLMGQAGLLEGNFNELYPTMLQKEYLFLKKKYSLQSIDVPLHFLRMRPANFPSVRLAQLARLIAESSHLFSKIIEEEDIKEIRKLLTVTANDYWHYHYMPDKESAYRPKIMGAQMINNILINTVIPIIFAYGNFHKEEKYMDKALFWLEQIEPENNSITTLFKKLEIRNRNAYDSQSLIQLKNEYCNDKKCLKCAVGNYLIKTDLPV